MAQFIPVVSVIREKTNRKNLKRFCDCDSSGRSHNKNKPDVIPVQGVCQHYIRFAEPANLGRLSFAFFSTGTTLTFTFQLFTHTSYIYNIHLFDRAAVKICFVNHIYHRTFSFYLHTLAAFKTIASTFFTYFLCVWSISHGLETFLTWSYNLI